MDVALVPARRRDGAGRDRRAGTTPAAQRRACRLRAQPELRALIGRLPPASQARYPDVADLSRDVLFHYVDEPLLERAWAQVLRGDGRAISTRCRPIRTGRTGDALIERLVWCPQPLRPMLLQRWDGASPDFREVLLDVAPAPVLPDQAALHDIRFAGARVATCSPAADYEFDEQAVHVVATYAPFDEISDSSHARSPSTWPTVDATRLVVVDLVVWRSGDACDGRRDLGRSCSECSTTATSAGRCTAWTSPSRARAPRLEHNRTHHFTLPPADGASSSRNCCIATCIR